MFIIVLIVLAAVFIKLGILLILVKVLGTALVAVSAVALGLIGAIVWKCHRSRKPRCLIDSRKKEDLI